jgi:hypothetical protein
MFGDRPSIIYEESEEESDFELSRTATNAHEPKHGESLKATGILSFHPLLTCRCGVER